MNKWILPAGGQITVGKYSVLDVDCMCGKSNRQSRVRDHLAPALRCSACGRELIPAQKAPE